jgi:serine/threonine-protein kinase
VARNPTRIGRYDLITALATGGMGRIYLGRAAGVGGFERKVVIKTLEVPVAADSDPAIAMFLDEARVLGQLYHQHIASVFEVDRDDDGRYYMVLDYVEGFSAHDVWERAVQFGAALPLDFALTVVSAVSNALHYTHTRRDPDGSPLGIVHRDVTPSNVMIGHDGAIKLIDFGIAMAVNRSAKTQTGFVKGKVGYLSPEQVAGRDVDPRTDVFALGILLYELTTQHRAFRDSSDLATMQRIKLGKVVRPSQLVADYPRELEAIVMKALQVEPRDRFADADAMRRAIEALGHRMQFVLGDAAIIEVMAQLFEPQAVGVTRERDPRASEPAFEWSASEQDLTVRRDPEELIAIMRAQQDRDATRMHKPNAMKPRKLRAATEAVDSLIVQSVAPLAVDLPLPLASPPPTPNHTPLPIGTPAFTRSPPRSTATAAAARPPSAAMAVPAIPPGLPRSPSPMVGAGLVARSQGVRLRWLALGTAIAAVIAGFGYFLLRGGPAGTAKVTPPATSSAMVSPAAARAPQTAPAPPKQVRPAPAAPPPAPTAVRVQIVSHPADATVFLDGKKLGHTPLDQTIAADPAKHVFRVKRRGYAMTRLDRELGADISEELTLSPQR